MIKKAVHENDLIEGMQRELLANEKTQAVNQLEDAVDYLNSAAEILEEAGMFVNAEKIVQILYKMANDEQDAKSKSKQNNLTSEKMLKNLSQHGTMFNMTDDNSADDLLNLEIEDSDLDLTDGLSNKIDFEDES